MYGLGSPLGLESGDSGGYLACPETFEKLGIEWHIGEITQAAIGQSEIQVTPLHMAVVASTIANEGVRYKPHLVDSVWNNAMTEQISAYEPEIVGTVETHGRTVYSLIERGMIGAAQTEMPAKYDLNKIGFDVAIKTGTPQSPRGTDTFVIGYAPADNPEIAFCAMVEGGKNAKRMVRQIIELYAKYYPDTVIGQKCRPYQEKADSKENN
jgi:penicillin-binding protein 2